ncbi:EG45-like domain containing protein [Physcomitrium patens]|uniref:EG45-like domain containing protein n=1 Tax=Physcomitrium patens TaxID=3218 RepID=UPI00016225F7
MARTRTAVLGLLVLSTLCLGTLPAMISAYNNGEATYYGPYYTPSACYGYNTRSFPFGTLIAAASSSLFRGGAGCGITYAVTCTGAPSSDGEFYPCSDNPTVAVTVVDFCPDCAEPGLALSQEAFSRIANPADADQIFIDFFPDDNF